MLHIPLYKRPGICADDPKFEKNDYAVVTEQTMMTDVTTNTILERLKPAFIFSGHDHEGCEFTHNIPNTNDTAQEYTVRSMMGDYGGVTGLFEIVPSANGTYDFHFHYCPFIPLQYVSVVIIFNIVWPIVYLVTLSIERKC